MAYNPGFPIGYTPYYPTQQQNYSTPAVPPPPAQNGIIWVQGEAGAKSYMVAPNNTVQLWDSEAQTIYLKSADASGMPTMKVLDYTIRQAGGTQAQAPALMQSEYITREEFSALEDKVQRILKGEEHEQSDF